MQSVSGQKNHTILQQNGQHIILGKLDSSIGRTSTTGAEGTVLQTTHSNTPQTLYPAHYIEAIAEQTVYAANGDNGSILEIKSGTPLRKLFASVTKSLPGQYQEYTPIIYAPVSGGQAYYQTANGQVLTTAFGGATGHDGSLHSSTHANLAANHAHLVTRHGATYIVQGGQLDETSAISHTAKASPVTVQWLLDNYETAEGVSLPRSTLYFHYLQHCNEHKLEPMNPASFGKLIRSVFYGLRTRRLGTRGNSKYHYYGIRIKPNSVLNHFVEDAGFALRHYPNYHRQTMEAAAEWKNFANSSLSRFKPSLNSNGSHHANSSCGVSSLNYNNLLRSEKPFMSSFYSSTSTSNSISSSIDVATTTSIGNSVLSLSTQHQHTQFLGEASSALPNLDEICRSSGLPVPSEVDPDGVNMEVGSNKSHLKSGSFDAEFCSDVITFCRLYALSAGYMLDAVVNLDFTSIETVWKAFWCTEEVRDVELKQSLSQERLGALVMDAAVLQFVRLYDHTFYQSLAEVLIPNVLRPIPPTLTQAIRNFAKSLEGWMRQATQGMDSTLITLKVGAVSALAQTLRRYTSLNHLAQAARAVLKNSNQINQMMADLNRVDFNNVQEQASWVCQCSDATVSELEQDFKRILQRHASLEEWAQWLDTVVTKILQPLEGNSLAYTRAAHQLILKWSFYSSMVIRDLTLRSAASFGSFHLIRLLYDEYIFYLVEHKVAAHLGMTPVAVMGEMGRAIIQMHGPGRLQAEGVVPQRDLKSDSSNEYGDYPSESVLPDVDYLRAPDTSDSNRGAGEDEEEIDEYLDDEEDVDDSFGDEGAMLKEAHASVQAYCRGSATTGQSEQESSDAKKQIVEENQANDVEPPMLSTSDKTSPVFKRFKDLESVSKSKDYVDVEKIGGSCSPPSIVTMSNPVRKVVRVTTFCDSRQTGIGSTVRNLNSRIVTSSTISHSSVVDGASDSLITAKVASIEPIQIKRAKLS